MKKFKSFGDYLEWVLTNAKGDESKRIKLEIQAIKDFKASISIIKTHYSIYSSLHLLESINIKIKIDMYRFNNTSLNTGINVSNVSHANRNCNFIDKTERLDGLRVEQIIAQDGFNF